MSEVANSRDLDAFVRFPWRIYANDPNWVPPLIRERKDFLNPKKHPFYRHGAATCFLARRGREVVGRILVSDDPHYNETHATNLGCFGMFESLPDEAIAHALLERAAAWLLARGRTAILGPIDYSTNYPCGLLVEGFDTPPTLLMNHNPPGYAKLLESWGLVKAKDLVTYWVTDERGLPENWRRVVGKMQERSRVRIRPFDTSDWDAEIARLKELYNAAWEKNWGFVKMSDAEFEHLGKELRPILIPELLMIAEVEGRPVGFCMSLPDINVTLRKLNGRLFPTGLLRLLWDLKMRKIGQIRMLTLGVIEGYRRRGITEMLIGRTWDVGPQHGYRACEMGWQLEDNQLMNRAIERLGSTIRKRYRIYERELA